MSKASSKKSSDLNTDNTAFYTTSDDYGALYGATSLLTIKDHLPGAKLYLLSSYLSAKTKRELDRLDVNYVEIDLRDLFFQAWGYPMECYYIFAGPEILHKKGFVYSVYVDIDTLCCKNPLEDISDVSGIASAGQRIKYKGIFGDEWPKLKKHWKISDTLESRQRINSGVVYFNNKYISKMKLLKKAGDVFREAIIIGAPRKGDDSLFSLLQYIFFPESKILYLESSYNYALQFNKWQYPVKDLVFFHFSIDKPWSESPYEHDNAHLDMFNPYVKIWRQKYLSILLSVDKKRWLKESLAENSQIVLSAVRQVNRVLKVGRKLISETLMSARGLRYNLFRRRNNSRGRSIKLYWWTGRPNFGDVITPEIIKKLFGYTVEWSPQEQCELVGAGSIMERSLELKSKQYIWGTGLMYDHKELTFNDRLVFCAVRGMLTRAKLGAKWSRIPLGDPGLLANLVYPSAKQKTEKVGVVPHYVDRNHPIIQKMRVDDRFLIINVADTPSRVAEQISSCSLVLSSSLHGLIFSDSFSVPNVHIELSDKVTGEGYKFRDYYSSIGKKYRRANLDKLLDSDYLKNAEQSYKPVKSLKRLQRRLIKAFPYKSKLAVSEELLEKKNNG